MEEKEFTDLLSRYRTGTASPKEIAVLETWYLQLAKNSKESVEDVDFEFKEKEIWLGIRSLEKEQGEKTVRGFNWRYVSVAAACLALIMSGIYFIRDFNLPSERPGLVNEIFPGSNRAVLTLANGNQVVLNAALSGKVAVQTGVVISKTSDGNLIYTVSENSSGVNTDASNSVETPLGGEYRINLPDGTKVWLNAGTRLKFPVSFKGKDQRKVELAGEAYFEVAHDKNHPFIVQTEGQNIEVLGTRFNVSAYKDEAEIRTTLAQGSIKVSGVFGKQIIEPGQVSILTNDQLNVEKADLEETLAWKNGYFRFNGERVDRVMRKLSRWYDIEVRYEGEISNDGLVGKISRYKNISQVLMALESTKTVHFKVEGRRVTVMQ